MDKKVCVDSPLTWWLCVVRACACLCVLVRARACVLRVACAGRGVCGLQRLGRPVERVRFVQLHARSNGFDCTLGGRELIFQTGLGSTDNTASRLTVAGVARPSQPPNYPLPGRRLAQMARSQQPAVTAVPDDDQGRRLLLRARRRAHISR